MKKELISVSKGFKLFSHHEYIKNNYDSIAIIVYGK